MTYLTLSEAAAYIERVASHDVEPSGLLRAGIHDALRIAAPFSSFMRNTTNSRNEDVVGLLFIPPRHLLEIELEGETLILGALSLDGRTMYSPQVRRTFQQLVILTSDIRRLIPQLRDISVDKSWLIASEVSLAADGVDLMPWIQQARSLAESNIARHRSLNLYPSQADIAATVEKELRASGIVGQNGRPVSSAYIIRNALSGEWWRKNKP